MKSSTSELPRSAPGRLARALPIVTWLPRYRREWPRPDVVAALRTWALVVPHSIDYAQIAGLRRQAGLLTAIGALLPMGCSAPLVRSCANQDASLVLDGSWKTQAIARVARSRRRFPQCERRSCGVRNERMER